MTGFELLEVLVKTDNEILKNEIFAGESKGDRVVDAYLAGGNIVLLTEMQRSLDAMVS